MEADLLSLIKDGGWLVFVTYLILRDVIPRLIDAWQQQANRSETVRQEGSRFIYSMTERQLAAWEKIADKLEQLVIILTRVEGELDLQHRTLATLMNSQAAILERLGMHQKLFRGSETNDPPRP